MVINEYLINELKLCNMWNENIKNNIIKNDGSIQYIDNKQFIGYILCPCDEVVGFIYSGSQIRRHSVVNDNKTSG